MKYMKENVWIRVLTVALVIVLSVVLLWSSVITIAAFESGLFAANKPSIEEYEIHIQNYWNDYVVYNSGGLSFYLDIYYAAYKMQFSSLVIAVVSAISCIVLMILLIKSAGYRKDGELHLRFADKVPLDIITFIYGSLESLFITMLYALLVYSFDLDRRLLMSAILCVYCSCILLFVHYMMSFAVRVKAGKWWRNTICYKVIAFIFGMGRDVYDRCKILFNNILYSKKKSMIFIVLALMNFPIVIESMDRLGWYAIIIIVLDIIILWKLIKDISSTVNDAVEAKIKGEKFKTELITNVSHDIKTPLTSIINYIDLLDKLDIEDETEKEYISVLNRQSLKLKKLVEDLIEASKAASGVIKFNMGECNVATLVAQSVGEYEEKLATKDLHLVSEIQDEKAIVLADGRYLWRVFDNVLNNICKYAQPNTRVYLTQEVVDGIVRITYKNISNYQLNLSGEELMERFVRGDKSRHTEGSGLGLSIAKNLIEQQGGVFDIKIDGDLFKIIIEFDKK